MLNCIPQGRLVSVSKGHLLQVQLGVFKKAKEHVLCLSCMKIAYKSQ